MRSSSCPDPQAGIPEALMPCLIIQNCRFMVSSPLMVPAGGLEPLRSRKRRILNPLRPPISSRWLWIAPNLLCKWHLVFALLMTNSDLQPDQRIVFIIILRDKYVTIFVLICELTCVKLSKGHRSQLLGY